MILTLSCSNFFSSAFFSSPSPPSSSVGFSLETSSSTIVPLVPLKGIHSSSRALIHANPLVRLSCRARVLVMVSPRFLATATPALRPGRPLAFTPGSAGLLASELNSWNWSTFRFRNVDGTCDYWRERGAVRKGKKRKKSLPSRMELKYGTNGGARLSRSSLDPPRML